MRGDLSPGQQLAQTAHAVGETTSYRHPPNTIAVILRADNQAHLLQIRDKLIAAAIPHTLIAECDGEAMAIGVEPTRERKRVRKVLSNLPLAG